MCRMRGFASAAVVLALAAVDTWSCHRGESTPRGTVAPADVAGPPADAIVSPSGLAHRVLAGGPRGRHPGPNALVVVNYTGWMTDGTIIDGAPVGTPPVRFELQNTMPGWQEGLRMMVPGDKWRFWIPAHLAYGDTPGKPHGMLVFDIYLVRVID